MLALVQYRSKLARDAGESMKAFQKAYDAISDLDITEVRSSLSSGRINS